MSSSHVVVGETRLFSSTSLRAPSPRDARPSPQPAPIEAVLEQLREEHFDRAPELGRARAGEGGAQQV